MKPNWALAQIPALATPPPLDPATPETSGPAVRASRPWRRLGINGSCLLIAVGAVILVEHALSPSLPGQAPSGSIITLPKAQLIEEQLAQALTLSNSGKAVSALQLYDKVLSEDPGDPDALAAAGWLEWNYGSAAHSKALMKAGRRSEDKAIRVAPNFYAGHLFLGLILFNQDDNASGAVKEFNLLLADHPPAETKSVAALVVGAYIQAGEPVPPSLESAPPTSTTPTSTTPTSTTPTSTTPTSTSAP